MAEFSDEDYTALCKAIAQGALSVTYGDKTVTYRTLAEMLQLKAIMALDLGKSTNRRKRIYPKISKGL